MAKAIKGADTQEAKEVITYESITGANFDVMNEYTEYLKQVVLGAFKLTEEELEGASFKVLKTVGDTTYAAPKYVDLEYVNPRK